MDMVLYLSIIPYIACLIMYGHLEFVKYFLIDLNTVSHTSFFKMELYSSTMEPHNTYSIIFSSMLEISTSMIEGISAT